MPISSATAQKSNIARERRRTAELVVPTRRREGRAKSRSILRDGMASSLDVPSHLSLVGKGVLAYSPPRLCVRVFARARARARAYTSISIYMYTRVSVRVYAHI